MRIMYLIFGYFTALAAYGSPDVFYFADDDGAQTIIYKASCASLKLDEGVCSLKAISVNNSKSASRCAASLYSLYEIEKAKRDGESWVVSTSGGGCDYIHTYRISKMGLVHTKVAPSKKKGQLCEDFEPKTFKYKYYEKSYKLRLNVSGCNFLDVLLFD